MNRDLITADVFIRIFEGREDFRAEAIVDSELFEEVPGLCIAALNASGKGDNSAEVQAIGEQVLDCLREFLAEPVAQELDNEPRSPAPPLGYRSVDEYLDDPRRGQADDINHRSTP